MLHLRFPRPRIPLPPADPLGQCTVHICTHAFSPVIQLHLPGPDKASMPTAVGLPIPPHQIRRGGWLLSYFTEGKSEGQFTQDTEPAGQTRNESQAFGCPPTLPHQISLLLLCKGNDGLKRQGPHVSLRKPWAALHWRLSTNWSLVTSPPGTLKPQQNRLRKVPQDVKLEDRIQTPQGL